MLEKRRAAMMEVARPHFEPGESVQSVDQVMLGQTAVSPLAYLIVGQLLFAFIARPRLVIATDRNIYVFELSWWKAKQINRLVQKSPLAGGPVEATKLSVTIGNEKVYAMLGQFKPMQKITALAASAGSAQALRATGAPTPGPAQHR